MNYKKIITAILLVSDGPVDHIYFVDNKTVDERGRETYTRTPKKYKAGRVYTLKPHIIKFKDDNDQIIEIKSAEPMNWDLVKKY